MGGSDNAWEIFQAQGGSQHVTFHSDTISTGVWYHLAVVRSGDNLFLFKDGVSISGTNTTGASGTLNNPASTNIVLGDIMGGTSELGFSGYIDDFRILDGYAKYTADFVPPTSAVGTSVSETVNDLTVLYLPFDDDSLKDQARNYAVDKFGNAQLSTSVKKFGTSSVYFDGTGDYLTIASGSEFQDFNSTAFTIEGWFYCTNDTSNQHNMIMSTGTGSNSWNIAVKPSTKQFQLYDGTTRNTTGVWTVNTWHHFAVCFDGSTLRQFIDGSQIRSESYSNLTTTFSNIDIGRIGGDDDYYFNGYLDDLRIIKGHAKYTANFTAPTSALGVDLGETSSSTTSDTKALSSTWTMTNDGSSPRSFIDMRSDNTWANNEHLQSSPGHRWYGLSLIHI